MVAIQEEVVLSIDTQGDTATASRMKVAVTVNNEVIVEPFAIRARICNALGYTDSTNATIAVDTGYGAVIATHSAGKDLDIVSMEANSSGVLTISGVASDAETVTIGTRVYEFDTDGLTTVGNVVVDVSASATAAQGTLTVDTQPTALDSMEIGGHGYVFVADGNESTAGEISVGTDLPTAKVNIVAAIMGTDGINAAHESVSAATFATDDCVLTALVPGTGGNAITSTENFTAVGNIFDAAVLGTTTAGAGCLAPAAVTALAAAITGDAEAVTTGVDGAGDTVDVVSIVAGYAGNAYASTETMANGAFGAATLVTGSIPSEIFINLTDATAETVTLRLGPAEIEGLISPTHGRGLDVTHAAP